MNRKSRGVELGEAILVAALVYCGAAGNNHPPRSPPTSGTAMVPIAQQPAATPVQIAVPHAVAMRSAAAPLAAASVPQPVAGWSGNPSISERYETAIDKRVLFDELRDSGAPEGFYFAAEILRDCMAVGERGFEAVVDEFRATLPIDTPTIAQKVQSFRQLVEPCVGFDGRRSSIAEIEVLYAAGALRGDLRASAHMLTSAGDQSVADSIRSAATLLESNDPWVIGEVSSYLAGLYARGMIVDGETLDSSENGPVAMAWALVACDFGAPCGAASQPVLQACARGGLCGIESIDELFRLTYVPPDAYQRGQQYHARILAALQRGDYAAIGLDASRF
ncbi:MAG: hypothetical protein ABJB04_03230 [Betaproteobacteria bacterium]